VLKPHDRAADRRDPRMCAIFRTTLRATRTQLKNAIGQIDSIVRETARVLDSIDDLRSIMSALSGRIDSITQHLEVAARNFDEIRA